MQILDLSGTWKLRGEFIDIGAERWSEVANKPDGAFSLHWAKWRPMPSRTGFMEAQVPCDVITPLVAHGLLKEPSLKTNTDDCMWVGDLSWWFMRTFTVTQEQYAQEELRLFIEMLDYDADILINGRPAGKHCNTFRAFYANVKEFLQVGENQIIIRLTNGYEAHFPDDALSYYGNSKLFGQRIYLRKPQFTHGWDWCKPVTTCGIGGRVELQALSGASISYFRCDTLTADTASASLQCVFEIENLSMCTADDGRLHVEIALEGKTLCQFDQELYLAGGVNFIRQDITLDSPRLWWPNGYGEQPLYTVKAYVECRGFRNDMPEKCVGIRTIRVDQSKRADGSRLFDFIVNGVKVFCKGGNWVPADSVYLRTPYETYKTLIEEARACHFTMLRVWGGGLYEPDCFYSLCSQNGILVMQDFMYACSFYPDHLPWFMHEAELEARYQTRRLAHQACMAVWTGNNEVHESYTDWFRGNVAPLYYAGVKIFNYMLPEVVLQYAPLTHYMPSSPFYGNKANDILSGDCHLWNWTHKDQETGFAYLYELEAFDRMAEKVRFSSEYGFYGALSRASVERFHDGEPVEMGGAIWNHHGEHERKRKMILETLDRHVIDTSSLTADSYLLYSGILQGILYDELATALRAHTHCSGDLIWMYNDCWPETGWTIIDYYLTRKISFYFLKRAFAPTRFIIRVVRQMVHVIALNETAVPQTLTAVTGYTRFDGGTGIHGQPDLTETREGAGATVRTEITVPAHGRYEWDAGEVTHGTDEGVYFVYSENHAAAADTAQADHFDLAVSLRGYYRQTAFAPATVDIVDSQISGENLIVTVKTDVFAPVVRLIPTDVTARLSDNYFPLVPGLEKSVTVYGGKDLPLVEAVSFA